ncbi:MAG: YbaY family lipoprotein [Caulobacterales bacterium]|nr:YbaY family lipoprotein [Caulobacterales bacterium]
MPFRPLLIAALVLPLVAACAQPPVPTAPEAPEGPGASHATTNVQVTATYRERILLPHGFTLTVKIEDISRADAPAIVIAEQTQTLDGRGPPYVVTLGVPASQIDPRMTYAARAEIRSPDGRLRFTTDTRHQVLTRGAPASVEIVMVGV